MSIVYTFTGEQNPAPEKLGKAKLPVGYEGVGEGEHLVGLYADLLTKGRDFPTSCRLAKAYFPAEGAFHAQARRVAYLLKNSGQPAEDFENSVQGAWWDFRLYLPLDSEPEAGLYLLRLILHFGESFDQMVASLTIIFDQERVKDGGGLPSIDALTRFQRLMSESVLDTGAVFSVSEAWRMSKAWEYSEVRKLLASTEDIDYFLRLAMVGCQTFEEALEVSKTMRKDWVYSLTNDV